MSLWPGHCKPMEDELLSSWLLRLARANGLKLHTMCRILFPNRIFRDVEMDSALTRNDLMPLSTATNVDLDRAWHTTLGAYSGLLFPDVLPKGNRAWILPTAFRGGMRSRPGMQFCPWCLDTDAFYFKRSWRLGFITICSVHNCYLLDDCAKCGAPFYGHRELVGQRRRRKPGSPLSLLCLCGYDFRKSKTRSALPRAVVFQEVLERGLSVGSVPIAGLEGYYSHLVFRGMYILGTLLIREESGVNGQIADIHRLRPLKIDWVSSHRSVGNLRINDRAVLMEHLDALLSDWPNGLLNISQRLGLTITEILGNGQLSETPYWLWKPFSDHLKSSPSGDHPNYSGTNARELGHYVPSRIALLWGISTEQILKICSVQKQYVGSDRSTLTRLFHVWKNLMVAFDDFAAAQEWLRCPQDSLEGNNAIDFLYSSPVYWLEPIVERCIPGLPGSDKGANLGSADSLPKTAFWRRRDRGALKHKA